MTPPRQTPAREWKGNPALEALLVPITGLALDPDNARSHGERDTDAIAQSLRRFGQQKPVVVRGDGVVLAGNGRLVAARMLGWTHLAVLPSTLTAETAAAYAIADNRTAELSTWDEPSLLDTLQSIQGTDGPATVEALGFSEDDMDGLRRAVTDRDRTIPGDAVTGVTVTFTTRRAKAKVDSLLRALGLQYPNEETDGDRLTAYVERTEGITA